MSSSDSLLHKVIITTFKTAESEHESLSGRLAGKHEGVRNCVDGKVACARAFIYIGHICGFQLWFFVSVGFSVCLQTISGSKQAQKAEHRVTT